jgi:ribosome-binding factor A
MSARIIKVNDLLRDLVSEALISELSLKQGVFVTLAKVTTSKDLRHARVSVSVYPHEESHYVKVTLKKESHALEKFVHSKLYMNPMPRLRFILDDTEEKADEVEKILLSKEF